MAKICIHHLTLGMVMTNVYLAQNTETNELIVIDPADGEERIFEEIARMGGKPVAVLLTHAHFDHILAAEAVRQKYQIPVYVEEEDEQVLEDGRLNLSAAWSAPCTMKADKFLRDGDVLTLAGFTIRVMHTPGHTIGSCCYFLPEEKVLFSGDTLFQGSYGRTDFPTSSSRDMVESLRRLLTELPDETKVYPGHNAPTTIGTEKRYQLFDQN